MVFLKLCGAKDKNARLSVDYIEEVPFKGKPDNTINICGEYIIFDAKSPTNDDLTNFPKYIKRETDVLKNIPLRVCKKRNFFIVFQCEHISSLHITWDYKVCNYN